MWRQVDLLKGEEVAGQLRHIVLVVAGQVLRVVGGGGGGSGGGRGWVDWVLVLDRVGGRGGGRPAAEIFELVDQVREVHVDVGCRGVLRLKSDISVSD